MYGSVNPIAMTCPLIFPTLPHTKGVISHESYRISKYRLAFIGSLIEVLIAGFIELDQCVIATKGYQYDPITHKKLLSDNWTLCPPDFFEIKYS